MAEKVKRDWRGKKVLVANGQETIVDCDCQSVVIRSDDLVTVDGIVVLRRLQTAEGVYLQFYDGDPMRSRYRGSRYVAVPLEAFRKILVGSSEC